MLVDLLKQPKRVAFAVGLLFFMLYVTTMPHSIVGYADSDELITVGYFLGVAHPPGYPLYVLLLHIFTHLPIPLSIPAKAHLLGVILSSVTISILYYTCYLLADKLMKKQGTIVFNPLVDRHLFSFFSISLIATSFLFWIYSTITEVYVLNNLLVASIMLAITLIVINQQTSNKLLFALAALWGLALGHHQTSVLLFPAIVVTLWQVRARLTIPRLIQLVFTTLITFILPLLMLFIFDQRVIPVSWRLLPGFAGWVKHIFRKEFEGTIIETGQYTSAYIPNVEITSVIQFIPEYLIQSAEYFSYAALLLGIIGFVQLFKQSSKIALPWATAYIFAGVLFAGILGRNQNLGLQAVAERQYLMGYTLLAPFLLVGWRVVLTRLYKSMRILTQKPSTAKLIILTTTTLVIGNQLYQHYPDADLSDYRVHSQLYSDMLEQVKPNALIVCFSDPSCFGLLYHQNVNQLRLDVTIIPRALPLVERQLSNQPEIRNFLYQEEPYQTFDYITWSLHQSRPVYVVDITELYYDILGISDGFLYYIPHGLYGEITTQVPNQFPEYKYTAAQYFLEQPIPTTDKMRIFFIGNISRTHQMNSSLLVRSGFRDEAREELNTASNLLQELSQETPYDQNFEQARQQIEGGVVNSRFLPGATPISKQEFIDLIEQWSEKERYDVAHKLALGLVGLYPEDIEARLTLAETFRDLPWKQMAVIEYQNVLKLDPDNQIALEQLNQLNSTSNR